MKRFLLILAFLIPFPAHAAVDVFNSPIGPCTQDQQNSLLQKYNVQNLLLQQQSDEEAASSTASQAKDVGNQINNARTTIEQRAANSGGGASRTQIGAQVIILQNQLSNDYRALQSKITELNAIIATDKENVNQALGNFVSDCQAFSAQKVVAPVQNLAPQSTVLSASTLELLKGSTVIQPISNVPAPTSQWNFKRAIRYGSKGSDVTDLQTYLANQGYYLGKISTVFNQATQTAVKRFQKDNHLKQTGYLDVATRNFINAL